MDTGIESSTEAAIAALRASLANAGTSIVHVLIDPMVADPLNEQQKSGAAIEIAHIHYRGYHAENRPYLVSLDDGVIAQEKLLNLTLRRAVTEARSLRGPAPQARSVCAWLSVEPGLTAKQLAAFIARRAVALRPDRTITPLRFYDPQVWPMWTETADQTLRDRLLGPITHFRRIDRDGILRTLERPAAKDWATDLDPIALEPRTYAALRRIGAIDAAMAQLYADGGREVEQHWRAFDAAAARAQREHGLTDRRDLTLFAVYAVLAHPRFDAHPQIGAVLAETGATPGGFAERVTQFDEAFWQGVRQGQWQST